MLKESLPILTCINHQGLIKSLTGFLRDFSVWLAEPVSCIFNATFLSWKQANVVPIPKVNSPTSIQSDLRPISLTPTLSKILESYVGNWILDHVTA